MRDTFRFCGKLLLLGLSCVVIGYVLMILVYCIPIALIRDNLAGEEKLAPFMESYPNMMGEYSGSQLDNYTDALMLLTASDNNVDSPFISALLNQRMDIDGLMPQEVLCKLYGDEDFSGSISTINYGRYWHGYLVLLKPLLVLLDYGQIRYLNLYVQLGLFTALCLLMNKRGYKAYILPVAVAFLFLNPVCTVLSIQFSAMTILLLLSILLQLIFEEQFERNHWTLLTYFFLVGVAAAYLDLLTFPAITIGIPLLFWVLSHRDNTGETLKIFISGGAVWCLGYGGMWAAKWLLIYAVTGQHIFSEVSGIMAFRTGNTGSGVTFSYLEVLQRQLVQCRLQSCLVATVVLCQLFFKRKQLNNGRMRQILGLLPELIIAAFIPLLWYAVLKNHSYFHYWFTYRELAVTVFALTAFIPTLAITHQRK